MIRRNVFSRLLRAAAVLPCLLAVPAVAVDQQADLKECLTQAEQQPDAALERAAAWEARGGGNPAKLCGALALFHRGDFAEAGRRLEDLATALGREDRRAGASILGRAGWAWLRAGDNARAERLYTAALEYQPGDPDLLVDRAIARAQGERFWDALADLDAVIAKDPKRADAWLYRAAAHKALSNNRQALADIARALELKPDDPEALLLRANIKALSGDAKGAQEDWRRVVSTAPDTHSARLARSNLEAMERAGTADKAPSAPKPPSGKP
ncbi:MAG TPA: tetratricopeptide repeat protein [Azospirillum sp.]|nr:tetratricopeptide repeat protein [Azospirillum sp.]